MKDRLLLAVITVLLGLMGLIDTKGFFVVMMGCGIGYAIVELLERWASSKEG